MLNCEQSASLSSQRMDRELKFHEKAALNMHLLFCRFCKKYNRQLQFLRGVSRQFDARESGHDCLSEEAKERMRERLKNG